MVIFINGAFGSGKTSAAYVLQSLLPNSIILDPEEVGYMLTKVIPENVKMKDERTEDFQDMELWRVLTLHLMLEMTKKYEKDLIVPMTIFKYDNLNYIIEGLKRNNLDVHHFCLRASEAQILQRLRKRGDSPNSWGYRYCNQCIQAFSNDKFEVFIDTDNLSVDDVVNVIVERLNLYSKVIH